MALGNNVIPAWLLDPRLDNRSAEWRQGFVASTLGKAKTYNPYLKFAEDFPDRKRMIDDWKAGWECKFYAEDIV